MIDSAPPRFRVLKVAAFGALLLASCARRTGIVPMGPHLPTKEDKPERVSRPPPPVEIEAVPLRRNPDCFFVDGYFSPTGNGWKWTDGEWILPQDGCYYAPPTTSYEKFGSGAALVHRKGAWHSTSGGGESCSEPRACPAPSEQKSVRSKAKE